MDQATTVGPDGVSDGAQKLVELLQSIAGGDVAAVGDLYRRTSAKLFGIIVRLLSDRAEAQDVLQEVYLQVWRNAARYDAAKASPITWLAVLTRNKAIDRLRQQRSVPAVAVDDAKDIPDEDPSALDLVCRAQDAAHLNACLEELEERPRTLIRAAFLDGRTYPQLALSEGVPLGTMKSWIRRGLLSLRGCLQR